MKRPLSISIFFPTYNEEDNIVRTVREAEDAVSQITDTYEIIIVNDGSKDKTGEMAERIARENDRVRVVHHNPNQGYGAAVWSGIKAARYDYVFFTDADLQFDLQEIEKLTDYLPEYKVVLGYRAKRQDAFMRLVNAKGWNILNRVMFGLKVKDIDCAFKIFDRRLVQGLTIKSRGAMMSAELLIRLQRMGIKFKEVPVTHLPREQGVATGAKLSVIKRAFQELFIMHRGGLGGNVTYVQVITFGMIGVLNTILDVGLYIALTRSLPVFGANLVSAKVLTFFLATIFSFYMNRRFTFGMRNRANVGELVRFITSVGAGVFINAGALYVFHSLLGIHDLLAVAIATVLTFAWGFIFSKFWVFRSKEPDNRIGEILQEKTI